MPPGPYTVRVSARGYRPHQEIVVVRSGERERRDVELEAVPVRVRFASLPPGAVVSSDGVRLGETPFARELTPGTYSLTTNLAGHQSRTDVVEVGAGSRPLTVVLKLVPLPARLGVRTTPAGAVVTAVAASAGLGWFEGVRTCKTDCELLLPPGDFVLEVEHPGYENVAHRVVLPPGGVNGIDLELTPGFSDTELHVRAGWLRWAIGLSAVAATGLGAGIGLGIDAQSVANRLVGARWGDETAATMNRGEAEAAAADVSMVAGAVAAAAASYFWVRLGL